MTSNSQNDEFLFLVSRFLDGDLNEDERRRMNELLREPARRAELDAFSRLHALLNQASTPPSEFDWATFEKLVLGRCQLSEENEQALGRVDQVLSNWSTQLEMEETRDLVPAVMAQIRPFAVKRPRQGATHTKLFRWAAVTWLGVPLAAAAALAFAVIYWKPWQPAGSGSARVGDYVVKVDVELGPGPGNGTVGPEDIAIVNEHHEALVSVDRSVVQYRIPSTPITGAPIAVVAFSRDEEPAAAPPEFGVRVSWAMVGSEPLDADAPEEAPSL